MSLETLEQRRLLASDLVSLADVQELAADAQEIWRSAGATDEQIAALESVQYEVADLGDHKLASYRPGLIIVDDNAAGNLWFVDQTPQMNEEFLDADGGLIAADQTLAYAKIDLLTALLHEQGHALGLQGELGDANDVMNEALQLGVRRLPSLGQANGSVPGSIETVQYLTSDGTGGGESFDNRGPYGTVNYVVALTGLFPSQNLSGGEPFLGSVELFAGSFAPRGFALAQGQLLDIASNSALFSILGTIYGGNGETTFALPDLRGRVPIGTGQGPGLENYVIGQRGGDDNVTVQENNLPSHTHSFDGATSVSSTGGGQAIDNRQPFLALTPVIATIGIFPSANLSSEDLLGSVHWFAGNFAPRGYAIADGSLLPISSNTALFSILGTTYGGDGQTTFALPDLRGRMAVHFGTGPGLDEVTLGQQGGSEFTTLTEANLPAHSHGVPGTGQSTGMTGGGQSFDNRSPFLGLNYNISLIGVFPSQSLDAEEGAADEESTLGEGLSLIHI